MSGPFSDRLFVSPSPRGRSWPAIATSTSLHIAALIGIAVLAHVGPSPTRPHERRPLTFVMMAPPPAPHEPTPALSMPVSSPLPSPEPDRLAPLDTPKLETPPPAPEPLAQSEAVPATPEPPLPAPPTSAPAPTPARTPLPVTVGGFADSVPMVHDAAPTKTVRDAGFDAPAAPANSSDTKAAAVVGAFDAIASSPTARSARPAAVVASAGFGSSRAETAGNVKPSADVRPSGFDAVRPAPLGPRAAPAPERVDIPVEILFKPAPTYTEEARRLKLEGDVLLDVEFAATGAVSVLQVVRGLGHGLDEAATTAAKQIRFKPAQTSGRPISFRTTVHIVFRLA